MTSDPLQLLKQLEPVVRPAWAGGAGPQPIPGVEHERFEELLARARQGRIESGRTVSADYQTGEALTSGQLTRLSAAADLAEASGAQRAMLLMDGRGLLLDVAGRRLTGDLSTDDASRFVNLDAAVYVPGENEETAAAPVAPPTGVAPPGVAEQIDAVERRPSAA